MMNHVDVTAPRPLRVEGQPTCVSMYSGAGGLDLGFAWAGFLPVWANDIDSQAVETYKRLFPNHPVIPGDVRAIADSDLPGLGDATLVIGGPPCQGFSVAGRMNPDDPRSRHVWDFLGMVRRVQPRGFVMENVKNLAVNARWAGLREDLITTASDLGFKTRLLLLNASHFGVPQARERMFLVGIREGEVQEPPPPTENEPPAVRSALETLPSYGMPGNDSICTARVTPARKPVLRKSPFAGMLFNGQGRPLNLDAPALTLPASMGGNRTPIIDQDQLEKGSECWVIEYHRHLWQGGEPLTAVPPRLRRLTVEEAAAIQTFPLGMRWAGKQSARFRQIGNAVPPELGYHVALAVGRALGLALTDTKGDAASADEGAERILVPA